MNGLNPGLTAVGERGVGRYIFFHVNIIYLKEKKVDEPGEGSNKVHKYFSYIWTVKKMFLAL